MLSLIPRSSDTRALGRAAVKVSASISYMSLLPSNDCLVVLEYYKQGRDISVQRITAIMVLSTV